MKTTESDLEDLLRRLVAAVENGLHGLQPVGESVSKAELVEALELTEAAVHRLLAELRKP